MGSKSKIEWTEATWNYLTGCTKISPGCKHCYAERFAMRMAGRFGYPEEDPFKLTYHPNRMELPLRWKKPRMIFVNSMSDLFHEDVPFDIIQSAFDVMSRAHWHTFQVLTKRPERMLEVLPDVRLGGVRWADRPLPNVWLGVSAEDQFRADERIPILLQTPAAVHFISCEPLLSAIYIKKVAIIECPVCNDGKRWTNNPMPSSCFKCGHIQTVHSKIDWVICGGESGSNARPTYPGWVRNLRDQCQNANIPFFFKQWGEWAPWHDVKRRIKLVGEYPNDCDMSMVGKKIAGRLLDGRTWDEYPKC